MENKYILLTNLEASTKKVYEKHFESEKYDMLVNNENMIIAKQTNNNDINLEHEKTIIEVLESMARKYTSSKVLYIDLTKDINSILKKIEGVQQFSSFCMGFSGNPNVASGEDVQRFRQSSSLPGLG